MLAFRIFAIFVFLSLPTLALSQENKQPDVIKMYNRGWTPLIRQYFALLIRQSLEHSEEKYGPYQFTLFDTEIAGQRNDLSLAEGRLFNVNFVTQKNPLHGTDKSPTTELDFAFLNGVLGLRKILIRKAETERFSQVDSGEKLLKLVAGQGLNWPDSKVYRYAGINVLESISSHTLPDMLSYGRFDFFPLGAIEIDAFLQENEKYKRELAIQKGFYIYYPIKVFASISNNYPRISERINYGMSKMTASGDVEAFFMEHFGKYLAQIPYEEARVFALESPFYPKEENSKTIHQFLHKYFPSNTIIHYMSESIRP